jgi:hypothetical protein
MESEYSQRPSSDLDMSEKLRKDVIRTLESHGARPASELVEMSEVERAKWLFWNLHENLDEIRQLEPTLTGQVTSTQLIVSDGQSMRADNRSLEKRLELSCKWHLHLTYAAFQNETSYEIGDGWINLSISDSPPAYPTLQKNQKAYLDADHSLYPNQLYLDGWITEGVWREIKPQLYSPNPTCRSDVLLLDNFMFPVKKGLDFVTGPPGSIGITNMEFRTFSHPTDRRMSRRSEPRQRT